MIALIVVAVLGLAATATAAWCGWTYGYRRGSDDCEMAHLDARDAFLDTMEAASRR